MKGGDERKGTRQEAHRTKKPSGWPDYFEWMVQCARKLVGSNDARAVANAALHDAYCPDRVKPPIENDEEVRRWLRCLIFWQAKAHWRRDQRWKNRARRSVDLDEEIPDVHASEASDVTLDRMTLTSVLEELSSSERTLITEYYLAGFTASELAAKYEMNESTVRTRIARLTTKLVDSFEHRSTKPRTWRAYVFLIELPSGSRFGQRITAAARSCLSKFARTVRLVRAYAGGAALGLLMPGDVAEMQPVVEIPGDIVKESEPVAWNGSPLAGIGISGEVYALPDKPVHAARWQTTIAMPSATREVANAEKPKERQDVKPIVLPPALPDNNDSPPNSTEACSNAHAEALTAWNMRADASACVDHLNRVPAGFTMCAETVERNMLRQKCEAMLSKRRP